MLATIDDWEAIVGPVGSDDVARVTRLLEMASDGVLGGAHGQLIAAGTATITARAWGGRIWLPQRPVRAVTSVVIDDVELVAGVDYRWEPGGDRRPALIIRRRDGGDSIWLSDVEATVTYDYGWVTIPGPIVAIVVSMARAAQDTEGGPAVTSWSAGEFSERVERSTLQAGDLTPSGAAQATLDRWCGVDGPTTVPIIGATG